MALLEIRDLHLSFGGLQALAGVDFEVNENEIVSVIGPNGAGKTSLFNAITGLYRPDQGDIVFGGHSLMGLEPSEITRAGIARTFQNVRLFPNMTVLENVMVAQHCRTHSGPFRAVLRTPSMRREEAHMEAVAKEILAFFGSRLVGYRFDQPAHSLSYANRRRLEMARAMATQPRLILLDEPVAGMNPNETGELARLIHRLRDHLGLTVVVVEHDMGVVREVSDRVVVLDHGIRIAEGTFEEVAATDEVIEAYLGQPATPT
ncbi:MAG: ABC transporter ATP-binding protein [Acidimicrobiia bacterium]|nr:ABC transporter ATP-binding protein [Acidimicrobiia bacterium]